MMASFLPVIVITKNNKTETNRPDAFYCSVSQIHINLNKNTEENLHNDFFVMYLPLTLEQNMINSKKT